MKNCIGSATVRLWMLLACLGCDAQIRGTGPDAAPVVTGPVPPGGVAGGGQAAGGGPNQTPASCSAQPAGAPLPARLRRLTAIEYATSLRALVGEGVPLPPLEFPPDAALGVFHNAAALLRVTDLLADGLAQAAQKLAQSATEQLPTLLGCDPAQGDEQACVRGFLGRFAGKAYRRPLSAAELQRLVDVYAQGRAGADVRAGVVLALEVVFQSPHLLYRTELGSRDATAADVSLTADELAGELSYLMSLGPPDAELSRAAAAGELASADAREAQARRLLQAPGARDAMALFASEWLDLGKLPTLSKDPAMFPGFSPDTARALQRQTESRFQGVMFEGDGKLRSLLMGGLLVEPSVLAAHAGAQWSSPTHRGKLILNQFLCQQVPPPPPGVIVTVPPAVPGVTTRQRMQTHASDASCAGCHARMDPLGFAFEHYDAVGAFRVDEGGLVIDATGQLDAGTDADGAFDGPDDLVRRLAGSTDVRVCFAKQWATFALGGEVNDAVACALESSLADFGAEQLSLPGLLVRLVRSEAFAQRHVPVP